MVANIFDIIEKKKTSFLFTITDKTLVWNGNNGEYNAEYCNECGIPIYSFYTGGGTIVSTPGDFNLGICVPFDPYVNCDYILNGISKIFKKYTNKQVEVSGNDIIVEGLKVLGSAFYKNNKMFMFVASVSMSNKNDLICNICYKHSAKQPGYIDFINANQLLEEIKLWLNIY
jgi:lipoate-protein ligase A